ncbi:MAG: arginine N-succinyltransferase [Alishewanella agri]|jgi:arginine N-succinyltransferase|uniref:arginine N-succinyltransferase n=1 Tax=Alishewanella sp. WH16-1 TaxID=1651088 RepID=UPI000710DCBD|nr:arginine N-succinyltransferase [Alishewanella sp. WH16-1]KRS20234.1 arginine N-succinyltransferase [Alishewanella sp. WH16-1]MDD4864398.1 arginine N-succinyltransferase [Alishewanella agri]
MLVIRPITAADFPALKQIAIESGPGFTSLPDHDARLWQKIAHAEHSFAAAVDSPGDQGYLFVLEDQSTGDIVGTTGIEAAVGLHTPLYHFQQNTVMHHSAELNVLNQLKTLTLCNDYTGASEICTLFLRESYRRNHAGRFLSKVRFLFMAEYPQRFSERVIAEMRGATDEQGVPPFWNWLQQLFLTIDFPTADKLIGVGKKSFIAELMPRHPIYVGLLPQAAQQVIGKVHENTIPALKMLEKEGFRHRGYIDLFDAGPTVEAQLSEIRSVAQSRKVPVRITDVSGEHTLAVANTALQGFRASFGKGARYCAEQQQLLLSPQFATALALQEGDFARFINLDQR